MGDLRLAIPAALAWIVLAVLVGIPNWFGTIAVLLWAVASAAAMGALVVRPKRIHHALGSIILVVVAVALVLTSAALAAPARMPDALTQAAQHHRSISATAVTDEVFHPGSARTPLSVTLTSVIVGRVRLTSRVPVLLFGAPDAPPGSGIGTELSISGTLAATEPGEAVAFLVFARGSPRVTGQPPWYLGWANALRTSFASAAHTLPGDGGDLLPGLAIGDTSASAMARATSAPKRSCAPMWAR